MMATVSGVWSLPARIRTNSAIRLPADAVSVLALLVLLAAGRWVLWYGDPAIGLDGVTLSYPMYEFLGEMLRAGDIPGWNPHQFSGVPFAADLQSGWTYLPVMVIFTTLPLGLAIKAFLLFHVALTGLATYALARVLGLIPVGALVASVSYALSGYFSGYSVHTPLLTQVAAWLPVLVLGAEMSVRSRGWLSRACWWGATGLALSQIFASLLGQRSYYALLLLGSYLVYRTLIVPPELTPIRRRVAILMLHGSGILLFGVGLAAAGLLPRLEYYTRSNLAHGYEGWAAVGGGWRFSWILDVLLTRHELFYAGAVTICLAVLAPRYARGWRFAPYFAGLAVTTLLLTSQTTTPLHAILYRLFPRFEELHRHFPERIVIIFFLGLALLAGATVSTLRRWPFVPMLLVLLVVVDLSVAGRLAVANRGIKLDPEQYYEPMGAADFMRSRQEEQAFRYFGYDPQLHVILFGIPMHYRRQFAEPAAMALVVNNRATMFRLPDLQGYNPVQPGRYVEFMIALNGHPQDYHGAHVLGGGLDSPLLDLLGARYVVVPAAVPPGRPDIFHLTQQWSTVYQDAQVRVLENPDALPRAWLVHEARRVERGEALPLLASGAVDPRREALLEASPPVLERVENPAKDEVAMTAYEPEALRLRTMSEAPSLLMLSESYDPNWRAYVDGERVDLYVADHALRAVPVPAGVHEVELRYESRTLALGMAISGGTALLFGALLVATAWQRRQTSASPEDFGRRRLEKSLLTAN
ncbi:MAG: YfhO family protein [Chloroflexia bacterium]|nr:YfhO family protein [Chloroflexia bacterium]